MKRFNSQSPPPEGFTLPGVLITLGGVGVIAAMTLPSIITKYQKEVTALKVKKFYNTINNAVRLSTAENGDVSEWLGEKLTDYEHNLKFLQTYILPFIKYNKLDNCFDNAVCVYLTSGGMFMFRYDVNGGDIFYFVNGKLEGNKRNKFDFQFDKSDTNVKIFVEPYSFQWDGTIESLKSGSTRGCISSPNTAMGQFCTKWIQLNNWKIPDDYPWLTN